MAHVDPKESNKTFSDNASKRQLDFPDKLKTATGGVCIEWLEDLVSGGKNIMTGQDTSKYQYRVRAVRYTNSADGESITHTNILMDTGKKFITSNQAHKIVDTFIVQQQELNQVLEGKP
tara:strand:+ start:365 stop:721 length:357 start_codon:yes stop_codon:yes gene_type:complete